MDKTVFPWQLLNVRFSAGVAQILNRLDRKTFNDADQRLFEVSRAVQLCCSHLEFVVAWRQILHWFLTLFYPPLLCLQAFVIFCGLGINNTMMYNQVKKTWAKQSVALDVRLLIIYDSLSLFQQSIWAFKFTKCDILSFNAMNKTDLSSVVFKSPILSKKSPCQSFSTSVFGY